MKLADLLKERAEIDALMAKWEDAKARGLDLDEKDKTHLLALLLTKVLRDKTEGYPDVTAARV